MCRPKKEISCYLLHTNCNGGLFCFRLYDLFQEPFFFIAAPATYPHWDSIPSKLEPKPKCLFYERVNQLLGKYCWWHIFTIKAAGLACNFVLKDHPMDVFLETVWNFEGIFFSAYLWTAASNYFWRFFSLKDNERIVFFTLFLVS